MDYGRNFPEHLVDIFIMLGHDRGSYKEAVQFPDTFILPANLSLVILVFSEVKNVMHIQIFS